MKQIHTITQGRHMEVPGPICYISVQKLHIIYANYLLYPYMNVTMHKKLSLFKNINQTTQNRKGRSARHRTSECIHLSLAQWLCSRLCWLVLEVARRQNREQRITPVREMVASIILMLQSLNITRQNTTLTLSFPFLRCLQTVYYQIIIDIQENMELGQRKSKFYRFY